jgi:phosphoglycolate phosphatase-like HAD superfamily hydrolase
MSIKLVIFDLDGVLINPKQQYLEAFQKLMEQHNVKLSQNDIVRFFGPPVLKVIQHLFHEYRVQADAKHWVKFIDDSVLSIRSIQSIPVSHHSQEVLHQLKSKKISLVLLTNSDKEFTDVILRAFDLLGFFNRVIAADEGFQDKIEACKRLKEEFNIKDDEAFYVGDLPLDVEVARKASLISVLAFTECSWIWPDEALAIASNPDYLIYDLLDLLEIVESLK